jgi:hypothetical protein
MYILLFTLNVSFIGYNQKKIWDVSMFYSIGLYLLGWVDWNHKVPYENIVDMVIWFFF